MTLHGVLVALQVDRRWRGVLIVGPSGAGKSDLGWRLLDQGFTLVADDRVIAWTSGGQVFGRAPEPLAGLMEAHGYGILQVRFRDHAPIDLVIDVDPAAATERMPEALTFEVAGSGVSLMRQGALEGSAPAKIRRWLMALG